MRRITTILLFLLLVPFSAQAAVRIGFVDLRKALNAVDDGITAKKQLQKKKSSFQKKLSAMQKALKRAKKQYDTRAAILRGGAKRKLQQTLQKKFIVLQRTYTQLTRQLAREESIETRKIFRKMEVIIRQISTENSLILMLEKTESSVLFALPSMDFTNELIRRYNRLFSKRGGKKKRRRRRRRRRRKK